ncbi:MAG: hypothetical protein WB729_06745 [Candidatus Sulfotelmatobacter sp.]
MQGREKYPVSQETCIGWEDYSRMGVNAHDVHFLKNSPRWAISNEKVKQVVAHKICIVAGVVERPISLEELRKVEEKYLLATRVQSRSVESQKHLETVQRFGGPLAFFTSLLYRRYRLAMNSVQLAREFGISPQNVRQQINRCSLIARALFPDPEDHLPWQHNAGRVLKSSVVRQRVFGVPKSRKPKFCIVCGTEVPKRHSKFCNRKCYLAEANRKANAKRNSGTPQPAFCNADCKAFFNSQAKAIVANASAFDATQVESADRHYASYVDFCAKLNSQPMPFGEWNARAYATSNGGREKQVAAQHKRDSAAAQHNI